jgi:hypothetical protein
MFQHIGKRRDGEQQSVNSLLAVGTQEQCENQVNRDVQQWFSLEKIAFDLLMDIQHLERTEYPFSTVA